MIPTPPESRPPFRVPAVAWRVAVLAVAGVVLYFCLAPPRQRSTLNPPAQTFAVRGIVERIDRDAKQVVVAHEAIGSYMGAMTMPFNVHRFSEVDDLRVGDHVAFRLSVTETESWIDQVVKLADAVSARTAEAPTPTPTPSAGRHPLLSYAFTNELGQPVSLDSFKGQALAITFFFTRCPIPDFCPRLSKNFAEASGALSHLAAAPTNWHFLSVSFDPEFDTPAVLKAYGERYQYNPAHWSFLTGPKDKITELARLSNVEFAPDSGLLTHNFRTMIIDAAGHLQMVFPMGGDLSQDIVSEMLKAAAVSTRKPS